MWLETPEIPTILIKSKYTILYDGRTIFDEWSPIFENKLPWHFRNKKTKESSPKEETSQETQKNAHLAFLWVVQFFFFLPLFFCFQVVYHHDAGWSKISSSRHLWVALRDQDPTTFLPMLEEFGDLNSWESKVPQNTGTPKWMVYNVYNGKPY